MDGLCDFLGLRNVLEETIQQLEKDKIDPNVLLVMTDAQLTTYLPSYGDRLAVLGYCRRKGNCPVARQSKLFERLKPRYQEVGIVNICLRSSSDLDFIGLKLNPFTHSKMLRNLFLRH
ncbi:hypothetical protein AALO_G00271930 [Alosa alosa]|uniref:Uncharacterized protein n=1 Tax=Alosa alosa TaxID=278164 RepID=A0AAV6FMY3_9TELE|nr:hypothetical protein AALO_G00271930 [Alosa alosa]